MIREFITIALFAVSANAQTYVRAARLFDGWSETLRTNATVVIENGRIARIDDNADVTLMPGLIDAAPADGVGEVRRQVRQLIADGADVIKTYMESYEKRGTRNDMLTGAMNWSQDEINALVEEAHRAGAKVAAHTYSDEAARMAIAAGVDSIEHGLYLKEETFRAMAEKGIYYVPTLLVYEFWRDGRIFGMPSAETKARLTKTVDEHTATFAVRSARR